MEKIFGLSVNILTIALLIVFCLSLVILAASAFRNKVIFKMAARNLPRRRLHTFLTILGLMLAAMIFSASFSTGDTLTHSIRSMAVKGLGETDIMIVREGVEPVVMQAGESTESAYFDSKYYGQVEQALANDPEVEGVAPAIIEIVPVVNTGSSLNEPSVYLLGVGPNYEESFDAIIDKQGNKLSLQNLGDGDIYINSDLADNLEANIGDTINIFLGTEAAPFTVKGIYEKGGTPSGDLSMVTSLSWLQTIRNSPDINRILITNRGGAISGASHTDEVMSVLESDETGLGDAGLKAEPVKQDALDVADDAGSEFTTVFLVFGSFSIIAGTLLIFLIFVMLAAERKRELGIARAVGTQRSHIIRMFTFEGVLYALIASAIGSALGIAFGRGMIQVMDIAFDEMGFDLVYHFTTNSLIISYTLGVILTLIVVIFSAWRVGRLNIVRAIRDIPDPPREEGDSLRNIVQDLFGFKRLGGLLPFIWLKPRNLYRYIASFYKIALWQVIVLLIVARILMLLAMLEITIVTILSVIPTILIPIVLTKWGRWFQHFVIWFPISASIYGILVLIIGLGAKQMAAYMLGGSLLIIGLCLLARVLRLADRAAYTLAGAGLLAFWIISFQYTPYGDEMTSGMEMFILSGIFYVAGAVWIVMYNSDLLLAAITFLFGRIKALAPVLKTAVSYPMASRFRTGMALAMFSLIIFTLVIMAVINASFDGVLKDTDRVSGGFHIRSTVSYNNPILPDINTALEESYNLNPEESVNPEDFNAIASFNRIPIKIREVKEDTQEEQEWKDLYLTGADSGYTDNVTYGFELTTEFYTSKSNEEIWKALANDPSLAVVHSALVPSRSGGGGPGAVTDFTVGEGKFYLEDDVMPDDVYVDVENPFTGLTTRLHVIGVVDVMSGPLTAPITTSEETVNNLSFGPVAPTVYLFRAKPDQVDNVSSLAKDLEKEFSQNGMDSAVLAEEIKKYMELNGMFFDLMSVFMGLGLIVGIAALGVIATRSVVERRQQIGVLRALGFQRGMVQFSFLLESSFISLLGITLGIILGLALSIQLIPDTGIEGIKTVIPWARIILITGLAYGASLLTTFLPAWQASRVYPAEAIRFE